MKPIIYILVLLLFSVLFSQQAIASLEYYTNQSPKNVMLPGATAQNSPLPATSLEWFAPANSVWLVMSYVEINSTTTVAAATANTRTYRNIFASDSYPNLAYLERNNNFKKNSEFMATSYMELIMGNGSNMKYFIGYEAAATQNFTAARNGKLTAVRIDNLPNSQYNYTFNDTIKSNLDVWFNNQTAALRDNWWITITPPTDGDYLISGFAVVDSDSATLGAHVRLQVNDSVTPGVSYDIINNTLRNAKDYATTVDVTTSSTNANSIFGIRNLTGGRTYNISMQLASNASSAADWQYISLFAMRLSGVFEYYNLSTTTELTTSVNTSVNYSVINLTNRPNEYLAIGGVIRGGSLKNSNYTTGLLVDGMDINKNTLVINSAGNYIPIFYFGNFTIDAGAHAIGIAFNTTQSRETARVKNSDILVIALGSIPTPTLNASNVTNPVQYEQVGLNATFYDNSGLSTWILSTNNSGVWANVSNSTTFSSGNVSFTNLTISAKYGQSVAWMFFANDSNNLWNNSRMNIIMVNGTAYTEVVNVTASESWVNDSKAIDTNLSEYAFYKCAALQESKQASLSVNFIRGYDASFTHYNVSITANVTNNLLGAFGELAVQIYNKSSSSFNQIMNVTGTSATNYSVLVKSTDCINGTNNTCTIKFLAQGIGAGACALTTELVKLYEVNLTGVVAGAANSCTWGGSGNWNISATDLCNITSPVNAQANTVDCYADSSHTGFIYGLSNIKNYSKLRIGLGCKVWG